MRIVVNRGHAGNFLADHGLVHFYGRLFQGFTTNTFDRSRVAQRRDLCMTSVVMS